jgi:hypothetical protein
MMLSDPELTTINNAVTFFDNLFHSSGANIDELKLH